MTKTVNIVRPFTLNLGEVPREEGEKDQDYANRAAALGPRVVSVAAGIQQLPDEIASHWFVKANSVEGQLDPKEYAAQLRAAAQAQRTRADEAAALADAMEAQADEAESEAEASGKESGALNPDPGLKVEPPPHGAAPDPHEPESDSEKTARTSRRHT
jgi:phosphosulfolactate synthase (CoM biosynthesis protein A)